MKIEPAVRTETKRIAIGTAILTLLMIAVFLVIHQFHYTVLLGALLGCAATIGNFFLMAMTVQKLTNSMPALPNQENEEEDSADNQDDGKERAISDEAKQAGRKMQVSFILRTLGMGAVAALAVTQWQIFNPWATLIPMLFPNMIVTCIKLFGKNQKEGSIYGEK